MTKPWQLVVFLGLVLICTQSPEQAARNLAEWWHLIVGR